MTIKFKLEVLTLLSVLAVFILSIYQSVNKFTLFWVALVALLYYFPFQFIVTIFNQTFKKRIILNVLIPISILLSYIPFQYGMSWFLLFLIGLVIFCLTLMLIQYSKNISEKGPEFTLGSICIMLLTCVVAAYI